MTNLSIRLGMIDNNPSSMHREYQEFYAVHVYLRSIRISLFSSYVLPKEDPKGLFLCYESVIKDLDLAECVYRDKICVNDEHLIAARDIQCQAPNNRSRYTIPFDMKDSFGYFIMVT